MKSNSEIAELALARAKVLCEKRRRKRNLMIAGAAVLALALIVLYIASVGMSLQSLPKPVIDRDQFLADAVIGGYVFAVLCGLIIGVAATLICQRIAANNKHTKPN
jgi:hypothetical protein